MIVVLMGVSGSGKTTIGALLAARMDAVFADADDFHSTANKAKMAGGHALTDDDRQPWLETLNRVMQGWAGEKRSGVLACSALKQKYRDTLATGIPPATLHWVFLDGSQQMIAERLALREHEYMNPNLLASQMTTLEPPIDGLRVVNDRPPAEVVDEILEGLRSNT